MCASERMEDTWRTWLSESTKQGSLGLTETEVASTMSEWIFTRTFAYMLWQHLGVFMGLTTVCVYPCMNKNRK